MKEKILLKEADTRASSVKYDNRIDSHDNYEKARDYLKSFPDKEALKTINGDLNNITSKNFDDPVKLKLNLNILLYNASLAEKVARTKRPGTQFTEKTENIPEISRKLVKEAGFDIQPNKDAQTKYTDLFNDENYPNFLSKENKTTQEQPKEKIDQSQTTQDDEDSSEENTEDDESNEEKETEYQYVASSPDKIAEKIKELKEKLIQDYNAKITSARKDVQKKYYHNAIQELEKLTKFENKAHAQQSRFAVYPTTSSKQKALTTAQIQYNNAKALSNSIVNKYSSKEIGSYASLYAKSTGEALKNLKNKAKTAIEQPSVAKDVSERTVGKITETLPKVKEKIKTTAERTANLIAKKLNRKNNQEKPEQNTKQQEFDFENGQPAQPQPAQPQPAQPQPAQPQPAQQSPIKNWWNLRKK